MFEPAVANGGQSGERARTLTLGAAVGIVISLFGISVPLAAIACEKVMRALDAAMAPPTFAVTSVHPSAFLLMAVVIAGLLLGKERLLRSPSAIAVNVSAAIIATVLGLGMLLVVIVPLIMIGESIAGG